MIGIYKIENKVNGKVYVGSALNIKRRWAQHKQDLRKKCHKNIHLQFSWNHHGEQNFQFEIIETILVKEKNYILEREQYWLDETKCYERDRGYNIHIKAENSMGIKRREESNQKNRDKHLGKHFSPKTEFKKGKKHLNFGNCLSCETKQKISKANSGEKNGRSKLDWGKVREIRRLYVLKGLLFRELGELFEVCIGTIHAILHNKTWKEENNTIKFGKI